MPVTDLQSMWREKGAAPSTAVHHRMGCCNNRIPKCLHLMPKSHILCWYCKYVYCTLPSWGGLVILLAPIIACQVQILPAISTSHWSSTECGQTYVASEAGYPTRRVCIVTHPLSFWHFWQGQNMIWKSQCLTGSCNNTVGVEGSSFLYY